jgi:hypothetical protein
MQMSKAFIFGFILVMALVSARGTVGFQSRQRSPEQIKKQQEFQKQQEVALYKAEIIDATPVQLGGLSEQQRKHSKLYRYYGEGNKKKVSELIAHSEAKVLGIAIGIGLGPRLTEPVAPGDYFSDLARASDAVIRGRVIKKVSQITEDDTFIFTDYDVVVMEIFKNNAVSPLEIGTTILVTRPGGKIIVNEIIMEIRDEQYLPLPASTQEVVLFLKHLPETGAYQATRNTGSFEFVGQILRPLTGVNFPPGVIQDSLSFLQTVRSVPKR